MNKEQLNNQNTHLLHQNHLAYLLYCQQIIYCLKLVYWLRAMYICEKSAIYSEKRTSGSENLKADTHQQNSQLKSLKHLEKPQVSTILAPDATYDSNTGRFLREDPLSGNPDNPPSLHRYNYAYSNPTRFIDPDGKYAEDGHYYTTLIVAEALGFTAEQVNTLALFSQLPDEVDNLDATELVKNKTLSMLFTGCIHCYRANEYLPFLHSLNGGKSEIETNRTIQAILANGGDMRAIGFLIHRLGDTFAHRKFGDEKNLYGRGIGHALDGHDPDVIQQRLDLYNDYVQTLISTLAQVKGGLSDKEIKDITQKVLAKTSKFSSAPLKKWQTTRYGKYGNPTVVNHQSVSNKDLTDTSIKEARRIVIEEVNIERKKHGKESINGNYQPEIVGVDNFFGGDVWLMDALNYYEQIKNSGGYNPLGIASSLSKITSDARKALEKAKEILKATPGVSLTEAEESNKALILIEGDDNKVKLKENGDG